MLHLAIILMVLDGVYRTEMIHLKYVFKRTSSTIEEFDFWKLQALWKQKKIKQDMWIQKYQIVKQNIVF